MPFFVVIEPLPDLFRPPGRQLFLARTLPLPRIKKVDQGFHVPLLPNTHTFLLQLLEFPPQELLFLLDFPSRTVVLDCLNLSLLGLLFSPLIAFLMEPMRHDGLVIVG